MIQRRRCKRRTRQVPHPLSFLPCAPPRRLRHKLPAQRGMRSGLFFEVVRIATDSGAWLMLLENVAGIASATATVVDEAEGELDERAAARVVGELADLGWDAEWITLSASDVGASHGRARWFCLAWRVADAGWDGGNRLDWENGSGRRVRAAGDAVDGFERAERRSVGARIVGAIQGHHAGRRQAHGRVGVAVKVLEQPARIGRQERRPESAGQQGRPDAALNGGAVADTSQSRLPQPELTKLRGTRGRDERRAVEQRCSTLLFAPGPADASWAGILAEHPHLAPALEPTFRSVVDGLAFDMGDSRAARLRCVGNGVVALCAATAVVVLVRRACLFVAQSVPKEVVMTDTALTRYASTGEQAHAAILAAEVLL